MVLALVHRELTPLSESGSTASNITSEWVLPCVSVCMLLQILSECELSIAYAAFVGLLLIVLLHVPLQREFLSIHSIATLYIAFVFFNLLALNGNWLGWGDRGR